MKRFDVLTIGLQVIDLMIPGMDGHILDREMTLLDHAELTLGGDALNQAIVLSQLGAQTALMGAAGVDRLGDVLLQQLSRYPLSVFDRRIDVPTAICVVLIDEAHERHFLFQPGQNLALRYEDMDEAVIRDSAFVSADGIEAHIPAFPCRCVDTTGAGDSFFAGVAIGLPYGKTLEESCRIGTRLAASVICTSENVCPRFRPEEFGIEA